VRPGGDPRVARLKLREPFNGLSHLSGAVLGIAAPVILVSLCEIAWRTAPTGLGRGLYVVMGWSAILTPGSVLRTLTGAGIDWLLAGASSTRRAP
jgi:predicted membrane channel-forming protein YqfA (hemolysin III family)